MNAPTRVLLMLWYHDDSARWRVEVNGRDLVDDYDTPGQALDAADRWATGRGFALEVNGMDIRARRLPAAEPEDGAHG